MSSWSGSPDYPRSSRPQDAGDLSRPRQARARVAQRIQEIRRRRRSSPPRSHPSEAPRDHEPALRLASTQLAIQGTVVSGEHVSTVSEPLNRKELIPSLDVPLVVGGGASDHSGLHLTRICAAGRARRGWPRRCADDARSARHWRAAAAPQRRRRARAIDAHALDPRLLDGDRRRRHEQRRRRRQGDRVGRRRGDDRLAARARLGGREWNVAVPSGSCARGAFVGACDGDPIITASAPSAIALATSPPLLMPPSAITYPEIHGLEHVRGSRVRDVGDCVACARQCRALRAWSRSAGPTPTSTPAAPVADQVHAGGGGAAADHHGHVEGGNELLQVARLETWRRVRGDDCALDPRRRGQPHRELVERSTRWAVSEAATTTFCALIPGCAGRSARA